MNSVNATNTLAENHAEVPDMLDSLLARVFQRSGINAKQDIDHIQQRLAPLPNGWHPNGDDTAAIPLGDNAEQGYQLFAIEGMQGHFVQQHSWFAGWCGVMVNCSDIAAMGGRPTAVVDAVWSHQNDDHHTVNEILRGMNDASAHLGVPIIGGHTNLQATEANLAVAILGHANQLLSSHAAKPGQQLIAAIDLRGQFRPASLNWDAATSSPANRMKQDLSLLPIAAERQIASACKDISQAGLLGTTAMMLESAHCGAVIDLNCVPKPGAVAMEDWLCAFPSFGYLLTTDEDHAGQLIDLFHARDIHVAAIGEITADKQLWVHHQGQKSLFYNLATTRLTGFS